MIYKSPAPDLEIADQTLTQFILDPARERGEAVAIVDSATGEATTYARFAERVDEVAAWLQSDGVEKGDVIGLVGPNSAEWAIAYHGILRAGATVTPMNPLLTDEEQQKQVDASKAKLVIDDPAGSVEQAQGAGEPKDVDVSPDDLAALPYSSGTTGLMKGVMLTHRNLVANIQQSLSAHPMSEDDTLVGLLPFFHIYGQTVVLNLGLSQGATVVTMPRFDLETLLDIIEEHRVSFLHIAPPVVLAFATAPGVEGRDTSNLRMVNSGAAPLDEDLAQRAEKRLGAPIRQGYGMTELSPVSHVTTVAQAEQTPAGSVGPLVPNTEARLVDPESEEDVAEGEQGEVWVRGPQVMRGYLDNDEATAETLVGDGWLRTGDIARIDEDGNFYIVDRLKELIKYKGYQVPPAELEAVAVSHPKVKDAGVIGIASGDGEEIPKACLVCDGDIDLDEFMGYVASRVAPYKKIREVEIVEEIPKSASGKILRRVLRDQHGAAKMGAG